MFWRFSIAASFVSSNFTGYRATDHHSPVPRSTPHAGTSGFRSCADLPRWLLPDTDSRIVKDRTGPDLDERPLYIQYVTEPGDSCGKINPFLPARRRSPLTILSWPEALNAKRLQAACLKHISRNACSLMALPDFPEFAPAVRYGVPGTRKQLGMVSPELAPTTEKPAS